MRTAFRQSAGLIALLLVGLACSGAWGQTDSNSSAESNASSTVSTESLRERLSELKGQLEEERAALEAQREEHETALEQRRQRRGALARRLLEAEAERQTLTERAESLSEEKQRVRDEVEALESARQRMRSAGRAAAERLSIHLRELPGRAAWKKRSDELREQLGAEDGDDGETGLAAVGSVAELLEKVHADGARLSVRETEIWAANGKKRRVELLSVGHVAFAYRAVDEPGRLAVTLASPADASGYRWSEDLAAPMREALGAAFDRVAGGSSGGGSVAVPMDVTGQLRAEALAAEKGLRDTLRSGGAVMLPLGAILLIALLLMLERVWQLYGRNGGGGRLAASVVAAVRAGRLDEAERRCRGGRSAQARVLAACLAKRAAGQHAMEDAIQEQLMHESPRLERFLGGLAVLAAIAPLLGLLGTVTGIIETFGVIRAFGNTSPSLMAGGISEALVTTATGLSIAIPILLIHSVLRGRAGRITAEAEKHAATLLNVLARREASDGSGQPEGAGRPDVAGQEASA